MRKHLKRNIKSLVAFYFLLFFYTISSGQNYSKLDNWLKKNVRQMGGRAVLMVYKDGNFVYSRAINRMEDRSKIVAKMIARRQGKEANTEDYTTATRQPIASCSKWLSAALVMTFVDEGKLKLKDTLGKFLPQLSQSNKGKITISDCLSNTTGIKAPSVRESLNEMRTIASMDEAVNKIAALPMEGEPGKVFHYSNIGLQLAAAVIEKISGKTFEILFAERIARPLEMKNSDFGKGKQALPAGGAFTTPEDYMNFLVMILNKGVFKGKRILRQKSIVDMQVNRVTPNVKIAYTPVEAGGSGYGYGYGEWVIESGRRDNLSKAVTCPGLFGSFPLVENEKKYCAFLMTYYRKPQGRVQRYKELKDLMDSVVR